MAKKHLHKSTQLGSAPMTALLIRMGLPITASMLIQAMYNIVDSIFVSHIGQNALNAISLAFPVQNFIIAIACGIGVGISTKVSNELGQQNRSAAEQTAAHGMAAALFSWLIFAFFTMSFARPFIRLFTNQTQTVAMGTTYLRIIGLCSFGVLLQIYAERLLAATGRTLHTMWTQLSGALINIILDPLLIFGIGPFPRLGVTGAAIATVTGQIFGAALGLLLNHIYNKEIRLHFTGFRYRSRTFANIFGIGSATIVIMTVTSVNISFLNRILAPFSAIAVNILGIYFKLESFVFMPTFGITNALVPIISYNYGARNQQRIRSGTRSALIICSIMMTAGSIIILIAARPILSFFNANKEMYDYGVNALRIIALSFPPAAINVVLTNVIQALRLPIYSMIVTTTRQLFVLLPVAAVFAHTLGLKATWHAFWIAELVALVLMLCFYQKIYREKILPLSEQPNCATS